jgi:hypothetical protein
MSAETSLERRRWNEPARDATDLLLLPATSRPLALAAGGAAVVTGAAVLVRPSAAVAPAVVLIVVTLVATGAARLARSVLLPLPATAERLLVGLVGTLGVGVGVLYLHDLSGTVAALAVSLPSIWLVSGVLDVVAAGAAGPLTRWGEGRRLVLARGGVALLAGGFVVTRPDVAAGWLVPVLAAWLVADGCGRLAAARPR